MLGFEEDALAEMSIPETILPSQLWTKGTSPERILLLAVLASAAQDLLIPSHTKHAQTIKREAEEWINGADTPGIKFKDLCLSLDLDPEKTRQLLKIGRLSQFSHFRLPSVNLMRVQPTKISSSERKNNPHRRRRVRLPQ